MAEYYHPDIVLTFPGRVMGGQYRGPETLKAMFRGVQEMFQGTLTFTCTWAGVIDNRGVVQWFSRRLAAPGRPRPEPRMRDPDLRG